MRNSTAESRSSSKVERQGEGLLSSSVDNSRAVAFRIKNELRDTFEQAANVGFNHVRIGSGVDASLRINLFGRAGKEKNRRMRGTVAQPSSSTQRTRARRSESIISPAPGIIV